MAYATTADMVRRFGQQEMIRLTTPAGEDMDAVVVDNADAALAASSAMMDSYIRQRYATPLATVPQEVSRVCGDIARYDLSTGDGKTPSDEVIKRYDAAIRWLRDIAQGMVKLDLAQVEPGDESYAVMRERDTTQAPFGGGWL